MNKCLKCGNLVPEDANICPFCGADLKINPNFNQQIPTQQSYQQFPQQQYQQEYQQPYQQFPQQQFPQQPSSQQFSQPTFNQQFQQVPFQSQQEISSGFQQPLSTPSVNYTQQDNIPKILGISSIVSGVIACPANIFALCAIFFSILGLVLGIMGFIRAKEQIDKLISGIGLGISLIMLLISCGNSILGALMFMGYYR
ncbi:MAG: zinc-ribbon domain-containing protein [bacterium]